MAKIGNILHHTGSGVLTSGCMTVRPSLRCIHKPSPPIIVPLVKHRDHCCPAASEYALIVRLPPRQLSDTPRFIFSRRALLIRARLH
jgi:hypothetical protein